MITIEPPSTIPIPVLSKPSLTRFLSRARAAVGLVGQVEVLLSSDAELKRLNCAYRGKNKATDVLSFPTPPEIADHHAGDLAISIDTAARQASSFGHSLEVEIKVLLLHGLLHLSGEDHEVDDGEMAALESELRTKLKLPVSLIDRVTNPVKPVKKAPAKPKTSAKAKNPAKAKIPAKLKPKATLTKRGRA
jgi:probable rRNA maturation factor